jgi:Ran GTPase-activating protein (RanGAP) involved in mRNA processing and transport
MPWSRDSKRQILPTHHDIRILTHLDESIFTGGHKSQYNTVAVSFSVMSDADSDADSTSDPSNAHSDHDDGDDDSLISPAVRVLCDRLRANDPRVLAHDSFFIPFQALRDYSEGERIQVFQALKENTSVKHIQLWLHGYTKRSAKAAAKYLESSQTLQTLDLRYNGSSQELPKVMSLLLQALFRNTSVTELFVDTKSVRFDTVAFQELLACSQTLQRMSVFRSRNEDLNEVHTAAIVSGFANNTTLRDLEFGGWRKADLVPVLTALQDHPALQKIKFSASSYDCLSSLSGLEVLLRSQYSKVKELILERIITRTVGLHPVMRELARNNTVTNLVLRYCVLSRENVQELKSMLRRNTALESLDLESSDLGSAGLAEIAPVLYRNTSIKALDLTGNGLHNIESANVLRELIRRNKTITSLCIACNAFGRNAANIRSIAEGVRSNTTLQQLDLRWCRLCDQGISTLANALGSRNASILELNLRSNVITSVGVRALVGDNAEAVKTLTKLCLDYNRIGNEGATILAYALGRNAMPSLKRLGLDWCGIDNDGFAALVSALEHNTSLQILNLAGTGYGKRGFMALAESLPNIKGLQQINIRANMGLQSNTLPLLLEGFRKNTSLVKVNIEGGGAPREFRQEIMDLYHRNRFTPLLKASDHPDASCKRRNRRTAVTMSKAKQTDSS